MYEKTDVETNFYTMSVMVTSVYYTVARSDYLLSSISELSSKTINEEIDFQRRWHHDK